MPTPLESPVRTEAGLTLVEVAVSSFVLAVAALSLAGSMAQGHSLVQSPREDYAAWEAIRNAEAELLSVPFAEAATTFHLTGFDVPGLRAPAGDADGLPGEIEFAYGPGGDTRFYRVTLRVRWQGENGPRVVLRDAYLANFRGDTGTPPPLPETGTVKEEEPVTAVVTDPVPVEGGG